MTAISAYAPVRRSSSILSNSSNNTSRVIRRSSSTGALVKNGTLFWFFIQFWDRIRSRNVDAGGKGIGDGFSGNGGRIREFLNAIAGMVSSGLTVYAPLNTLDANGRSAHLSPTQPRRNRGISSVLIWLVSIAGGNRSRIGRILIATANLAKEILLRSLGAASVILTGSLPTSGDWEASSVEINVKDSLAGADKPVMTYKGLPASKLEIDAIRRERGQIDEVLIYWFGQASPDGAQKSLWMIASSSSELLDKVDADISHKFRQLILDLSGLTPLLECGDDESQVKLEAWTKNADLFGWQGKLAAIVVLDQMSRHIHRHDEKRQDERIQIIPKQQTLDSLAYDIAKMLKSQHHKELSTGMIPLPMQIFGVMPLRHASTVQDLTVVQHHVESASALHDEMERMIRRFRKASNRRMAALQDKARREGKLGSLEGDATESGGEWTDEKILECFPFQADMSNAHDHAVIKTIGAFLSEANILQLSDAPCMSSKKTAVSHRNHLPTAPKASKHIPTAIVSLSGGVDSMVIVSALAHLRDTEARRRNTHPADILRIVAIHIDYANRPESGAEASYVGRYCNELGAKFICRKIDEVTRGVTARDDYERKAREIRFGLYRECCAEALKGTIEAGVGVMLGHHRGDLRENVISNAHKGCGPLDLSGMTAVSKNNGVTLFRPLLSLEKTHIYSYSHSFGVPYFKDTTPHWSTRGKLRNRLLPLLEEIYGEGSMDNLSSLAEESDNARALVKEIAMSPFMDQVRRYPMGISFETSQWKGTGFFFWKFVLRQVLHSAGLGMFSDKSIESFLNRIHASNLREGWLQCRKDYAVFLQKDGRVFVLYPSSFPFGNGQRKDQYDRNYRFLGYGPESGVKVGPWTVISDLVSGTTEDEANSLLQTKALRNMDHLMAGDIEYFIKVPILNEHHEPCPLVAVKGFTKPTRPYAWKGFDIRVENTLPLMGVDLSSLQQEDNRGPEEFGNTWTVVRVQLSLDPSRDQGVVDSPNKIMT